MTRNINEVAADIYRAIIADTGDEGIGRKEALDELVTQISPMVRRGEVTLDVDDAIRAAGMACDEADGKRADAVLRAAAAGEDSLDIDDDPVLDLVTILGEGKRKAWRFVTAVDLREMDRIRYRNLRSASDAYDRWRQEYEPWLEILARHDNLGAAVVAGDLPDLGYMAG